MYQSGSVGKTGEAAKIPALDQALNKHEARSAEVVAHIVNINNGLNKLADLEPADFHSNHQRIARAWFNGAGNPLDLDPNLAQQATALATNHIPGRPWSRLVKDLKQAGIEVDLARAMDGRNAAGVAEAFKQMKAIETGNVQSLANAILEASELVELDLPERRTFLHPWISESQLILIYASRNVGKSFFVQAILEAIAKGRDFGRWQSVEAVPCLYLDAEMTAYDTRNRFKNSGNGKAPLFVYSSHLAAMRGLPPSNLLDKKWRDALKSSVLDLGVKVLALDNLVALTPGQDLNLKELWDPVRAWLLDLRFAGVTTLMVHHAGKGGDQLGTTTRENDLDFVVKLEHPANYRVDDGCRFIARFTKTRANLEDLHLLTPTEFQLKKDENGETTWTWADQRLNTRDQVLKMLGEGIQAKDVAAELDITPGRVSQIKKQAIKDGLITHAGKPTSRGA